MTTNHTPASSNDSKWSSMSTRFTCVNTDGSPAKLPSSSSNPRLPSTHVRSLLTAVFSVALLVLLFIGGHYVYTHDVGGLFAKSATTKILPPYLLLGLALVGGATSFFSPCSIALTPTFLTYFIGTQGDARTTNDSRVVDGARSEEENSMVHHFSRRVLKTSVLLVLGILTFYAFASILVSWIGVLVYNYLIYIIPAIGAIFLGLGYIVFTGRSIGFLWKLEQINPANRYYNAITIKANSHTSNSKATTLYLFGVSYGAASHTCTLPIFLGIVLIPLSGVYWLAGVAVFIYGVAIAALFMSMLTIGRNTITRFYRRLGAYLQWVTGGLFIISGSYLLLYFVQNYGGLVL